MTTKNAMVERGMQLEALSDEALLASLRVLCAESQRLTARIVMHLGEVEERSLHLRAACTSMFDYCVRKLGMSEGAAQRRLVAARVVRRFPAVLGRLERGELHLSGLALIARHLTEANVEDVLAATARKSMREIEGILARYAPKPDVPDEIRAIAPAAVQGSASEARAASSVLTGRASRLTPLSEERHKVQFTASTELRAKLELARDRMLHRNPSGDLAIVVERALDLLLEKLAKERLGESARPREVVRSAKGGAVSRAVRREVFERDGEQRTFRGKDGARCPARAFLELDHVDARARGGSGEPSNIRVRCRAHNRLHAEEVFGKEHVDRRIDLRRRTSRSEDACETPVAMEAENSALAVRGLVSLGFAAAEARRALELVSRRHGAETRPLAMSELLRGAIAVLT